MSHPALKLYHKEAYPAIDPRLPAVSQSGKTVVVSGASSGIGLSIARSFVAAGAEKVILLGRRQDVLQSAADGLNRASGRSIAEGRSVDVYNPESIDKFWSGLEAEKIYVDALVLNAASFGKPEMILRASFESTWGDFEANVRSPLAMTLNFAKQTTGNRKKFLLNVSTIAAYMWSTMAPERPTYGLTKSAGTLLVQQIAKDTSVNDMQIISFHPGGIFTEASRASGAVNDGSIKFDHEDLPGHFAVWAASAEAAFLHGRFVWANWDVEELKNGIIGKRILEDEHFLKVGIEGLSEKDGGARF